jgi:hypothetical protein
LEALFVEFYPPIGGSKLVFVDDSDDLLQVCPEAVLRLQEASQL